MVQQISPFQMTIQEFTTKNIASDILLFQYFNNNQNLAFSSIELENNLPILILCN